MRNENMRDYNELMARIANVIEPVIMNMNAVEFYELVYPAELKTRELAEAI